MFDDQELIGLYNLLDRPCDHCNGNGELGRDQPCMECCGWGVNMPMSIRDAVPNLIAEVRRLRATPSPLARLEAWRSASPTRVVSIDGGKVGLAEYRPDTTGPALRADVLTVCVFADDRLAGLPEPPPHFVFLGPGATFEAMIAAALDRWEELHDSPDAESTRNALMIVGYSLANIQAFNPPIESWTPEQRRMATEWALREHLSAGDNDEVERLPRPSWVPELPAWGESP